MLVLYYPSGATTDITGVEKMASDGLWLSLIISDFSRLFWHFNWIHTIKQNKSGFLVSSAGSLKNINSARCGYRFVSETKVQSCEIENKQCSLISLHLYWSKWKMKEKYGRGSITWIWSVTHCEVAWWKLSRRVTETRHSKLCKTLNLNF